MRRNNRCDIADLRKHSHIQAINSFSNLHAHLCDRSAMADIDTVNVTMETVEKENSMPEGTVVEVRRV